MRGEALRRESLYRELNDSLLELYERTDGVGTAVFLCECAVECPTSIEVRISEYASVREHPTRFIVLAGHEDNDIERIVARRPGYLIVEKPVAP